MKIALIGTVASGMLGFRADLIKSLVKEGNVVYAFSIDYDDASRQKVSELGAIPVDYIFSRTGMNPFLDLLNTYRLSKKIKKIEPDIVFSYFAKPVIFGTLAAAFANVKRRIGMLEGLGYFFTKQPDGFSKKTLMLQKVQILLYRISFIFLERIIFLNQDDPVDLIESNNIKIKNINVLGGIGVDLDDYRYQDLFLDSVSFIFVARLLKEKGVNEFIAAAKSVKKKYPEVEFIILGAPDNDNPGGVSYEYVQTLKREGLITYPGHVNNVKNWIEKSSVFVLPSYYREGIPRSTQEAMAIGRAVITTNVPGCRETVVDGVNGFLVRPWSPEDLEEKMLKFIKNKDLIKAMGLKSRELAQEKFDSRKFNEKIINIFNAH